MKKKKGYIVTYYTDNNNNKRRKQTLFVCATTLYTKNLAKKLLALSIVMHLYIFFLFLNEKEKSIKGYNVLNIQP